MYTKLKTLILVKKSVSHPGKYQENLFKLLFNLSIHLQHFIHDGVV